MENRTGSKRITIIEGFFRETFFAKARIVENSPLDMRYLVTKRKTLFMRNAESIELMVLVSLESNEINFVELVKQLLIDFHFTDGQNERKLSKKSFRVGWIMCSDSGGIYLWEALETKEHRRLQGAAHAFTVVNSVTGAVCFTPGAIENRRVGDTLRLLSEKLKGSFFNNCEKQNKGKREVESVITDLYIIISQRLSRMRAAVK